MNLMSEIVYGVFVKIDTFLKVKDYRLLYVTSNFRFTISLRCLDRSQVVVLSLTGFESRQSLNGLTGLLLGQAKIINALQVEPKLSAGIEVMSKAQGRVAGDRTLSVQNFSDAVCGHLHLSGEFGGTHVERI